MKVIIYHNPACGTSRNTLAMIRQSGEEPTVIEYLSAPPSRERLTSLIKSMNVPVRSGLREKETLFSSLNLSNRDLSDDQLIDAMIMHPPDC
jgi:arsenate reductase